MKETMMQYGINYAKRYTEKQKLFFLDVVSRLAKADGYHIQQETVSSTFSKAHHLIVGEIEKADYVVVSSYDTLSSVYLPCLKYYPLHVKKNIQTESIHLFIQLLLSLAFFGLAIFGFQMVNGIDGIVRVLGIVGVVIIALMGCKVLQGFQNPVNFNRNSASIALMMEWLKEKPKKVAYIFLDKAASSFEGMQYAKTKIKDTQTVIVLDCIAQGELLVCAHSTACNVKDFVTKLDAKEKVYDTDCDNALRFFHKAMILTSGSIHKKEFVVKHTRTKKDYEVDIPRLEKIKENVLSYMEEKR